MFLIVAVSVRSLCSSLRNTYVFLYACKYVCFFLSCLFSFPCSSLHFNPDFRSKIQYIYEKIAQAQYFLCFSFFLFFNKRRYPKYKQTFSFRNSFWSRWKRRYKISREKIVDLGYHTKKIWSSFCFFVLTCRSKLFLNGWRLVVFFFFPFRFVSFVYNLFIPKCVVLAVFAT